MHNPRRRRMVFTTLPLMLAIILAVPAGWRVPKVLATDLSGDEILARVELALFPENYRMRMRMVTTEPDGREREMELQVQYRRGTGAYMEIESPPRSRGTRFLQRDDSLWMFIPRSNARSAIRLSGRDSFQGSVFSNRDIGESMYTEDYRADLVERRRISHAELGEVAVYRLELSPRHQAAAYGRVVIEATEDRFIPLHMRYYVRSGMNTKEMNLSDIRSIAGRERPVRMEMISHEEAGKTSVVHVLELEADDALPDRIFTQRHLTR